MVAASYPDETLLDRSASFALKTEQRFPLALGSSERAMWDLYEAAIAEVWDPESWDGWGELSFPNGTPETRDAAALLWSHQAWLEFQTIAESEALVIRLCLEPGTDISIKYMFAMRAVERARAADLATRLASVLHRYHSDTTDAGVKPLLQQDLHRRVLHLEAELLPYFAARPYMQGLIEQHRWAGIAGTHEAAPFGPLLAHVAADKTRQYQAARHYLASHLEGVSERERQAVAQMVEAVVANEELRGRQVVALLADGHDRSVLADAQVLASEHGLAPLSPEEDAMALEAALTEAATDFSNWGLRVSLTPEARS